MRTIHKYAVGGGALLYLANPIFRHVGEQDGQPHMWVEVDTEGQSQKWQVTLRGTGWTFFAEAELHYLGTIQMSDGLVWHVFAKELP